MKKSDDSIWIPFGVAGRLIRLKIGDRVRLPAHPRGVWFTVIAIMPHRIYDSASEVVLRDPDGAIARCRAGDFIAHEPGPLSTRIA